MRLDVGRMTIPRTRGSLARSVSFAAFALLASLVAACHGAGPYGHSPNYVEIDDETAAVAGAREYDPVMAQRQPDEWRAGKTTLFGVVESRTAGPGGQVLLKLGVRRLELRNLCGNMNDDDTCRVTVSDGDFGTVWAVVALHREDDVGPKAIGLRSLVRIVGTIGQDVSPTDGAPLIHATWYRHWPPMFYVTKSSARDLRQ
jgi:hypothetical protein